MTLADSPRESEADANVALRSMIFGFQATYALRAAVDLRLAELLAAGPIDTTELAAACAADAQSLTRLLRALSAFGVVTEEESGRFGPTPQSELLRRDHPHSLASAVLHFTESWMQDAWGQLTFSVQTGRAAFQNANGEDFWQYLAARPSDAALFNEMLANLRPQQHAAIVTAYDFEGVGTLVDLGGGYGQLLSAVLRAYPSMRGILFDLPAVVVGASPTLEAAGVADRCTVVGGDLFAEVPRGGHVYLLSYVIHDWDDERSAAILARCRRSMEGRARLLLVEGVAVAGAMSRAVADADLRMMVLFGEASQRTEGEFRALLERAGFQLTRIIPTATDASIIEAVPRDDG